MRLLPGFYPGFAGLCGLLLLPLSAHAATTMSCSSTNAGDAVINEIYTSGGGTTPDGDSAPFIELKILDNGVDIESWTLLSRFDDSLQYSAGLGDGLGEYKLSGVATDDDVPDTVFDNGTWLWYEPAAMNDNRGEVILLDGAGNVIDYICFGKISGGGASCTSSGGYNTGPFWRVPTSCGARVAHNASNKDMARIPDGAGTMADHGKADDTTRGNDNSGASSTPIHHLELVHDGAGLTCAPETITLKACTDAACTAQYTGSYTVNLSSPASGWSGGSSQTFTGSPQTLTLWHTTAGTISLGASSTSASNATTCDGPGTSTSCAMTFSDSGFVLTVPDVIANKPSSSFTIQAVMKTDSSQTCATNPAFNNATTTLNFWGIYNAPASGTQNLELRKPGDVWTSITTQAPTGSPVKTALALSFNAMAQASVELRYVDAGKIDLNLDYTSTPQTGQALTLTGVDSFVSVPAGFCVEALYPFVTPTTALANCADSSCSIYQKAGRDFPLRVRAMNWQVDGETGTAFCSGNSVTPNFRQSNLPLTLTRPSASDGIDDAADASLTQTGTLGQPTLSFTSTDLGQVTIGNQSISEVGRFTISTGGTYSDGDGVALPVSASNFIGRIIPDSFTITFNAYNAACGTFTYAGVSSSPTKNGQYFTLNATINAVNATLGITSNYHGAYAPLNSVGSAISLTPSPAVGATFNATKSLAFNTGSATYAPLDAQLQMDSVQAPLTKNITLALSDNYVDSLGLFGAAGTTLAITGTATSTNAITYRLGRLFVDSAYGPEQLPLTIPLRAEYFDGTRWSTNTLDNCTTYVNIGASLSNYSGNLTVGNPTVTTPSASKLFSAGQASALDPLQLSAPGTDGSVDVQYNINDWLKFDWFNQDGAVDHPIGRANFGRYRGADRIIYWKEIRNE